MQNLAMWPPLALALGILLQLALGRVLTRTAKGWLALACGLVACATTLAMVPAVAGGQVLTAGGQAWDRAIPWLSHVDGLSLVFMLMATGIGSAILLYCIPYMAHEAGTTRFYALMLTFIAGLVTLVTTANLLVAYVAWELIGLCSYFLVGFWYREAAAVNGARKVLVMTHLPGYALLLAILLLFSRTGTFLWTDPALATAFTGGIFALMLLAAMAKSVLFPLHTWIPEAMNAPTPVSALLHSACYVKAGVYLIARTYSFTPAGLAAAGVSMPTPADAINGWPPSWTALVVALGCITMVVGAIFALAQTDLKRLLAFSTISQLGNIVAALGLATSLGLAAGLFYCFSHALFKGTLFLCAGAVQHAAGTRDMRRLGGLARKMPGTARIWLIAAASIVGVPLCNGFVAKWLLFDAALNAGAVILVATAWVTSLLTAFYMLKATATVFYGEPAAGLRLDEVHEAPGPMLAGMGVLAALCLVFGIAPQMLMQWVIAPAVQALGFAWRPDLSFLGFQAGASGLQVTAGAALALVALLAGLAIYQVAGGSRRTRAPGGTTPVTGGAAGARGGPARVPVFSGGEPLPVGDGVGAVDFADLAQASLAPVAAVLNPDPLYLAIWQALLAAARWLSRVMAPVAKRPLAASLLLAALIIILALAGGAL